MNVDRRKFIGGSDASAVLGINPWRTPLQLWQDKTQPAMPENIDPDRARILARGKRMEPYVLDLLTEETGLHIVERNARYVDPEHPFLAAEIDAEALLPDRNEVVNVEIKTSSPFKAKEWGEEQSDAVPVYYTAQAQHGMMVRGRALCIFGVLIGADDFRVYRVERDEEIIAAIRAREVAFWREHVEAMRPPAPVGLEDIERLFAKDAGTSIEATPEVAAAVEALRDAKAASKRAAEQIAQFEEAIKGYMREHARLTIGGRDAVTWRSQTASRFSQREFQSAEPALFEKFLRASESRVFRIK